MSIEHSGKYRATSIPVEIKPRLSDQGGYKSIDETATGEQLRVD
jgi:hypothetical protein